MLLPKGLFSMSDLLPTCFTTGSLSLIADYTVGSQANCEGHGIEEINYTALNVGIVPYSSIDR